MTKYRLVSADIPNHNTDRYLPIMGIGMEGISQMEAIHCRALELTAEYLVENLDMQLIIPHLLTRGILSFTEVEIIQAERARPHQVMKLMMLLPKKGPKTFDLLCEALVDSEQAFIADELRQMVDKAHQSPHVPSVQSLAAAEQGITLQASMEQTLARLGLGVPDGLRAAHIIEEEPTTLQPDLTIDEPSEPVSYYFSRPELQQTLQDHLLKYPCLVMSGVHGSGKTQLARFLSQRCRDTEENSLWTPENGTRQMSVGFRFEVNCRSLENMSSGLEVLAEILKLKPEADSSRNSEITTRQLLARILCVLDKQSVGSSSILLFDDMTRKAAKVLSTALIKKCKNTKIIITTNISTLLKEYKIAVDGFGSKETLEFFRENNPDCDESDEDILDLGAKFSYLPLGLAAAKMFMVRRSQTIADYLEQLLSRETVSFVLEREASVFEEDEYDKSLISALQMSLESIRDAIGCEAYKAFELTALLSPHQIPLQFIRTVISGTYAEKLLKEGDIIDNMQHYSLATILKNEHKEMVMNIHSAVQLAMRLSWSAEEEKEKCDEAIFMMAGIVDKDTRTSDAYQSQWELVPHVQSVIQHCCEPFDNIKTQLAEIKLLEFLGHMYVQISVLQAEEKLLLAKSRLFQYFIGKTEEEVNQELFGVPHDQTRESEMKAKYILDALKQKPLSENIVMQFVLQKTYYEKSWLTAWKGKVVISEKLKKEIQSACLTMTQYEKLVEAAVALPKDVLQQVYLPEVFVTNLYTFGRLYFYQASSGVSVPQDKVAVYHQDLHVAFGLCNLICEDLKIQGHGNLSILHWLLVQRFGLLYLLVEDDEERYSCEEIVNNALKAKEAYEELGNLGVDFYQHGFLKARADDSHNKAACMRQLIKCYRILLQYEKDKIKHEEYSAKATEFLKQVEKELEEKSSVFQKLMNGTMYFIQLAQLLLLLGDTTSVDKAISYLSTCCDDEKATQKIKYPWLQALISLKDACIKNGSHENLLMCEAKLKEYHSAVLCSFKDTSDKRIDKVSCLMEEVHNALKKTQQSV